MGFDRPGICLGGFFCLVAHVMSPGDRVVFRGSHSLKIVKGAGKRRTVFKHEAAWIHAIDQTGTDELVVELGNGQLAKCDQSILRLVDR